MFYWPYIWRTAPAMKSADVPVLPMLVSYAAKLLAHAVPLTSLGVSVVLRR